MTFVTIAELEVGDRVIPDGQTTAFTVTDLHPTHLTGGEYVTVAVTLWDGWKERTERASVYTRLQ